jgi:hypothetical protein
MDDQIVERLEKLRVELLKGERQLEALERERQETRDTLLRISGAIQVLDEMLARSREPEAASLAE